MKEYRIFIVSALIVCITAVKLCFPENVDRLREKIGLLLCNGKDYAAVVQVMGRSLGMGNGREELIKVINSIGEENEYIPVWGGNDYER